MKPPRREAAVSIEAVDKSKTEKAVSTPAQDYSGFGMQDAAPKAQLCRAHYEHFGASPAPKGAVRLRGAKRPVEVGRRIRPSGCPMCSPCDDGYGNISST